MRRWSTMLIVGAIVALAVLAAADALRGRGGSRARPNAARTTVASQRPLTLPDILRREAVTGFITYSDPDCVVHSLLMPRMLDEVVRNDDGSTFRMCRFNLGGGRYLEEDEVPSPDGTLVARCRNGHIAVWQLESGIPERSFRGCPPAWRPDGRLTYPRGDVVILEGKGVLFTVRELRAVARRNPN